jgi:hypothetical protein
MFGQPAATPLFGAAPAASAPSFGFGATSAAASAPAFGATAFGATPATTSLFGAASTPAPATSSLFGSASAYPTCPIVCIMLFEPLCQRLLGFEP